MPTARKLPSGSWRCRVYSHTDESGKKIWKSFTCSDPSPKGKRICEEEAAAWAKDKEQRKVNNKTFGQCADEYINIRRNTLSPRTIEDYEGMKKRYLTDLSEKSIEAVTQKDVQRVIDTWSAKLSPKTVGNIHCFISAVLRQERPALALTTSLPQRTKPNLTIPSDQDVKRLLEAVRGTTLELPVMLAAFGPMREGEICALRADNIDGTVVHVCENMVKKVTNGKTDWIIRHPKSTDGDRFIDYPQFVANMWKGKNGRLVDMNPNTLCKQFKAKLDSLGMSFRFHDLRHYSASIQHALGVPDAYIMQRGGWSSDRILKAVYRHAMDDQAKKMNDKVNGYFGKLVDTKVDTKRKRPRKNRAFAMPATGIEPDLTDSDESP
jgi:integrase